MSWDCSTTLSSSNPRKQRSADRITRQIMDSMDRDAASLNDVQDNLFAHFRSLARVRERSGFPIFALEHGLSPEELKHVSALLRARIRAPRPLAPHWLLWAVYASEAGYGYTGDEYWPSFEKQTPNWQYQDRPKVKRWFEKFQSSFNGVAPSGSWAEHFSIIAWPITHALLPRYLQRQFAKLLYDLRFRLTSDSLDAGFIGRLLAANASHTSTRFQAFLEQEELTGQVAVALLREGSVNTNDLIHPPTLNRVVEDLERVRNSREWLKETRRVVADRFKGIGRGTYRPGSPTTLTRPDELGSSDAPRFAIRPYFLLRHVGSGKWSLLLQLKSLRSVAAESADLRVFLNTTRCQLNGASDWKPTGWLLSGNRKGTLKRWPDQAKPLIQFEQSNPVVDHLLESEFRLPPGPVWLFRIGADGLAPYIASPSLRPGRSYIIVTAGSTPCELPESSSCALECGGVQAFRLDVPDQVSVDLTARLRKFGLDVARTIRVWPAGLPGRGWDGEGSTEWLTTESPCFGIAPDHPLDALSFRLDDDPEQVLATDPQGGPTFVRLPPLPAGVHTLTVEAHRSPNLNDTVTTLPAKGFATLVVREPEPWIPGLASHSGLTVTCDPFDASLDVLWRNELNLSVNGPDAFTVAVRVKLHGTDDRQILSDLVDDSMALPIAPDAWRGAFDKFLDNEARAWKYLEAASCTLEINGDFLGTCTLRFDRDPSPLRWAFEYRQHKIFVHLVDDSGQHDTVPNIQFFSLERPLIGTPLDAEVARTGVTVQSPGGLYFVSHPPFCDTAVVSAPSVGLKDLSVEPKVYVAAGLPSIRDAFLQLRRWHDARPAGFLVDIRRQKVTRCIFNAIFKSICGENWARAEKDFAEGPLSPDTLEALETLVDKRMRFGRGLSRQSDANENDNVVARFAAEARRHGISHDHDFCRFALRVAARQASVLADPGLDVRVGQLVDNPVLLRGARLVSRLHEHDRDRLATAPGRPT